jgi:hypothetical protein
MGPLGKALYAVGVVVLFVNACFLVLGDDSWPIYVNTAFMLVFLVDSLRRRRQRVAGDA